MQTQNKNDSEVAAEAAAEVAAAFQNQYDAETELSLDTEQNLNRDPSSPEQLTYSILQPETAASRGSLAASRGSLAASRGSLAAPSRGSVSPTSRGLGFAEAQDPNSSMLSINSHDNPRDSLSTASAFVPTNAVTRRSHSSNSVCILSFNCWGLKWISKNRAERIRELATKLAQSSQYDIIALQELWVEDDYDVLRVALSGRLPYSKRFVSGVFAGPGLAVFSRWPIIDTWLHRFSLNGRPSAFYRGDWYVGKALSGTLIAHPSGETIEILNSHMHAPYGPGDAAYTCHRAAQAWDIARAAQRSRKQNHVTFVVGDLNSVPGSVHYSLFELQGGLSDAWVQCKGEYEGPIAGLSAEDQIRVAGVTADSRLNTWRCEYESNKAKRLDYIFFDPRHANVTQASVELTEISKVAGSLSDHFGVSATFSLKPCNRAGTQNSSPLQLPNELPSDMCKLYDEVLVLIAQYVPVSEAQTDWRVAHMVVSILALIAMLIAIWWAAGDGRVFVAFIFTLFGSIILTTGIIDGLIALLFGPSERRALREFESEVWLARTLASQRDAKKTASQSPRSYMSR